MEKICKYCGKIFKCKGTKGIYCSRTCNARANKPALGHKGYGSIISHCLICGKEINSYASNKRQYCSSKCFHIYLGQILSKRRYGINNPNWKLDKEKVCEVCGKTFRPQRRKAIYCSMECMGIARKGSKNPAWQGGSEARNPYAFQYRLWRNTVFERDNYMCQDCQKKGGKLEAHHIALWVSNPEVRFLVSNGITLCRQCHLKRHFPNHKFI